MVEVKRRRGRSGEEKRKRLIGGVEVEKKKGVDE